MKEKYFSYKYLISFLILFTCLFIFSIPSLALIPGDFGSAGGGPPDGCVDFEDLMIFAMAYGSTPADANWNLLCDIYPDNVIDFEDLMIFAMNYGQREQATWTVMFYMDGDSNLEPYYWQNVSLIESVSSTEEVNIVIQMDPYDDCTGTFRYYVTSVEAGSECPLFPEDIVQNLPEQDMSDPVVLTDFINWASDNYPADHYMLFIVDHGAGWKDLDILFKGILWDDTTGFGEYMDIPELAQSLESANINIDILCLKACLMQMTEVAWEIGKGMFPPPNYLIGSENVSWTSSLPYEEFLNQIIVNSNIEQSIICETIVNGYIENLPTYSATMSALHFNNEFLNNSLDIINNFANALLASTYQEEISNAKSTAQSYANPQYKDLYDFAERIYNNVPDCQTEAQAIMDLITTIIIAERHDGSDMENSHGLSIYLIDSPTEYDSAYDLLQFATDTPWDEFLKSGPVHNINKDTYYNTIQIALDDADSGNTIEVADGTYDESITFPSDKVIILQSVNGASSTTIRGDNGSPTATFDGSLEDTTLEGFTITHADGLTGRGINIVNSTLSIENCNISGNSYHHSGSGIYNSFGGILTITESTISDNSSVNQYGNMSSGGIYNGGTLTINGSTISDNYVSGGGGYTYYCGSGGGISNSGTLTITASTISGNYAGGEGGGSGGGISNGGTLTITGSTVSDNSILGYEASGGGISNGGTLTITGSTISGNNSKYDGGGILNTGILTITASTVSDNSVWASYYAWGGGISNNGGTLTITASIISGNYAGANYYNAWGGGIYNNGGTLTIIASTVSDNYAWAYYYDAWGGIYLSSSGTIAIGGDIAGDKNTICGNYNTGEDPFLDQQIRDDSGSLYETYKDTNYISIYCE